MTLWHSFVAMNQLPQNSPELSVLVEIRDLIRDREERYEAYLKASQEQYARHAKEQRSAQASWLIWLCFAVTVGVFLGGLMLRATSTH